MIVYVHAADIYDRGLSFQRHEGLSDVVHLTIPRSYSVMQIVSTIISHVRNEGSIYTMIWNGHGNRGHVGIGQGIGPYSQDLAFLAPYMTPHGHGVEIHSCLVASATNNTQTADDGLGVETVRRFAYFLGCPVRAAYGLQYGQDRALFGLIRRGDTEGVYETPWITAHPNGAVAEFPSSARPWQ